jgi:hypothetical protein
MIHIYFRITNFNQLAANLYVIILLAVAILFLDDAKLNHSIIAGITKNALGTVNPIKGLHGSLTN